MAEISEEAKELMIGSEILSVIDSSANEDSSVIIVMKDGSHVTIWANDNNPEVHITKE